jgi:hypothetical protein
LALLTTAALLSAGPVAFAGEELASVSGQVTLDGRPLPTGKVFIHLSEDEFAGGRIKDGRFHLRRVPVGAYKVTVELLIDGKNAIPPRYALEKQSALRIEVQKGKNEYNLTLVSK